MSNKIGFISNVVYSLKRRYGVPIKVRNYLGVNTTDFTTGNINNAQYEEVEIKRAIVLPKKVNSDVFQALIHDKSERTVILSSVDLSTLVLSKSTTVIYANEEYNIKDFFNYEDGSSIVLIISKLNGE